MALLVFYTFHSTECFLCAPVHRVICNNVITRIGHCETWPQSLLPFLASWFPYSSVCDLHKQDLRMPGKAAVALDELMGTNKNNQSKGG